MFYYHDKNHIGGTILSFLDFEEVNKFYKLVVKKTKNVFCQTSIFSFDEVQEKSIKKLSASQIQELRSLNMQYAQILQSSVEKKFENYYYLLKMSQSLQDFFLQRKSIGLILPSSLYFDFVRFINKDQKIFLEILPHENGAIFLEKMLYEEFLPVLKIKHQPVEYQEIVKNLAELKFSNFNYFNKTYKIIVENIIESIIFNYDLEHECFTIKISEECLEKVFQNYPKILTLFSKRFQISYQMKTDDMCKFFEEEYLLLWFAYEVDFYYDILPLLEFNFIAELGHKKGDKTWNTFSVVDQDTK